MELINLKNELIKRMHDNFGDIIHTCSKPQFYLDDYLYTLHYGNIDDPYSDVEIYTTKYPHSSRNLRELDFSETDMGLYVMTQIHQRIGYMYHQSFKTKMGISGFQEMTHDRISELKSFALEALNLVVKYKLRLTYADNSYDISFIRDFKYTPILDDKSEGNNHNTPIEVGEDLVWKRNYKDIFPNLV